MLVRAKSVRTSAAGRSNVGTTIVAESTSEG
jgi:hypothetical protein